MKNMKKLKNAIILCSGGLDSVVTAFYVKNKSKYNKITILFFNYGQRALMQERECSKKCALNLKANFLEINLNLNHFQSLLINKKKLKKLKILDLKNTKKESEKYYVPLRNSIFLINAIALSESFYLKNKDIYDIFVGFKCEGNGSYPDTTKEFVNFINKFRNFSLFKGMIKAHLITKDKDEIVLLGKKLNVNFKQTYSCYISSGNENNPKHCGTCLACRLRQEAFYWANLKDPTEYKEKMRDFRLAEYRG